MKKCAIKKGTATSCPIEARKSLWKTRKQCPIAGHCLLCVLPFSNFAVSIGTPKSSVNFQTNFLFSIYTFLKTLHFNLVLHLILVSPVITMTGSIKIHRPCRFRNYSLFTIHYSLFFRFHLLSAVFCLLFRIIGVNA